MKSVMEQIARDIRDGTFPRKSEATLREEAKPRYFISEYTDGPATRWNVIDRQTQEWVRRFASEAEAQQHANKLNALPSPQGSET
jgi:predicted DNA-binding WGR domain protein